MMSRLQKICGLMSICLAIALLTSCPAQADESLDSLGASVFFTESGSSLVGSLIQIGGPLDGEGSAPTPAAANLRSSDAGAADVGPIARARLGMARPQIRPSTRNAAGTKGADVSTGTSGDAFNFSRAALPILIESLPGVSAPSLSHAHPMIGPVVGVRPSYVKAAAYR